LVSFRLKFAKITTESYFIWLVLSLGILYLVFDTSLATIYTILIMTDFVMYYFNYRSDKVIQFPLEKRTDNRLNSIITAVIAYGPFLILTTGFLLFASPQSVSGITDVQAVIKLMASSVPIFAGSLLLSLYAFGFMVPAIESSLFFGRLLEKVVSVIEHRTGRKVVWNKVSKIVVIAVLICASIFTLYHMGSKGLANVPLMVTFIFGTISVILVLKDGELKSAVLLHMISNSLVILSTFGVF